MSGGVAFQGASIATIQTNIGRHGARLHAAVGDYAQQTARDGQSFMRQRHPWTNRTGTAERHLLGVADLTPHRVTITLAQAARDRRFLETAHSGRWGIVPDAFTRAVQTWRPFLARHGLRGG